MLTSTIGQLTAASVIAASGKIEGEQSSASVYYTISALSAYITSQVQDSLIPIGFTYVQYPTMTAPSSIWTFGTWTDISSTFAGAFFRAEGGNASAFESGVQTDAMQGHRHWVIRGASTVDGSAPPVYLGIKSTGITLTATSGSGAIGDPEADGTNGTVRTAIETRPRNYTIKIWRRTA